MGKDRTWSDCKTHGDVIAYVLSHGCQELRINGSHKIFRGPNGRTFPIQCNHLSWHMVPGMKGKIKRELLAAGVPIVEA